MLSLRASLPINIGRELRCPRGSRKFSPNGLQSGCANITAGRSRLTNTQRESYHPFPLSSTTGSLSQKEKKDTKKRKGPAAASPRTSSAPKRWKRGRGRG